MDLSKYYTSICKFPNLSAEDEVGLFKRYYSSEATEVEKEKIKATIINSNLRFAFKQAKIKAKGDMSLFEILVPAANEGLVVGFLKYNHKSGFRFMTYAGHWVFQRILKEMSVMRIVSLPIWKQQVAARIQKAKENNEKITIPDLVKEFPEVNQKDVMDLFQTQYLTFYIDDFDNDEFEKDDILVQVERKLDDERVRKAVAELQSPHREVIAKMFGLEDGEEYTIPKLCKALKIPKDTLRTIHAEGLDMLKYQLGF